MKTNRTSTDRAFDLDGCLSVLLGDLSSAHVIVHAPSLFVERVWPAPSELESGQIQTIVREVLWPMACDRLEHSVLNRVRLEANSPVLPYRILVCPLVGTDHAAGFLAALRSHDQAPYAPADLAVLRSAIPNVAALLKERLDPKTGLLLRASFEAEMASRGKLLDTACIVYANLDQVHVINELDGFAGGDQVIGDVGRLWRQQILSSGSFATHLFGDRFAAVLAGHTLNQARTRVDEIRERLAHLDLQQGRTHVTASFGIAAFGDVASFPHALAAAETACRVAKERGRNRVELYVTGDHTVMRRHEQVREGRWVVDALDNDRFILFAQPIVQLDPAGSQPVQYEILLRMQDADGQFNSISGFLEAAERYQLLERLDRWVIAHVLKLYAPVAGAIGAIGAKFTVNVTGQSLSHADFTDFVRTEFKSHDIPAGVFNFEITETAALQNVASTRRFISRMAEIGARVALDDFGTGLSSLVHLKDLDVYRIKIDGKFVRDLLSNSRSRVLVRALVQIAEEIGFETVAEFVENAEIAASVRELGVQYAQGYFYGRPQPMRTVIDTLLDLQSGSVIQKAAIA